MSQEQPTKHARIQEEISQSTHETASAYAPTLVGSGHEHFVFTVADHSDVVIKVNMDSIQSSLSWHKRHGGNTDDFIHDEDAVEDLERGATFAKEGMRLLRTYFGEGHVPQSRYTRFKIPVLPSMLQQNGDPSKEALPTEIYVSALVQELIPELRTGTYETLTSPHTTESDEVFINETMNGIFPSQTHATPHIPMVYNSEQKETIRDFVTRAIRYSEETGKILDVAGSDNIILRKIHGKWDYVLVDALFPATWQNWLDRLRDNMNSYLQNPDSFDFKRQASNIINSTNYVRFINDLALSVEIPERLDYFQIQEADFPKIETFLRKGLEAWKERRAT